MSSVDPSDLLSMSLAMVLDDEGFKVLSPRAKRLHQWQQNS